MKDFRELINIIEQNVLPAPMEPTYRIDPKTGQSVPDIDYKLNPGMKPAPEPSDLPRLDAPMEPTYRKDPRTGQMVPDIDYKLNPQMKPAEPAVKPQSRPVPKAPASGSLPSSSAPKAPSVPRMPTVPAPSQGVKKVTETQLDQISEQLVSEIAKTVNVATKKKNQRKHLRRAAEKYQAHLIKNLPQLMKFLDRAVKGWRPSEEQMMAAIETAYNVMKHTGDKKQAGKAMMDELNTLHRMSQGQQGVAEGNRFDEPLTGYHIVYKKSGKPVLNTPSFETKDQAQKYLMTKMFANHQDFKVVHTASVGVAEGSLNEFAPDPDSNGNDDSDDPIGDLALAAARRLQVHEMPRNTAIKAMMTDPELIRQLKLLDPDIFHSREEFKGLCVYAIQQVRLEQADDEDGDYDYYYRESIAESSKIMTKIASAGKHSYDMIEKGINGLLGPKVQRMLQDMYDDVVTEKGLHADDDFEQIYDYMMTRIISDYGHRDIKEGQLPFGDQLREGIEELEAEYNAQEKNWEKIQKQYGVEYLKTTRGGLYDYKTDHLSPRDLQIVRAAYQQLKDAWVALTNAKYPNPETDYGYGQGRYMGDSVEHRASEGQQTKIIENLADEFAKMLQDMGRPARVAGTPEQERSRTRQELERRSQQAAQRQATPLSDQQRNDLKQRLSQLEARIDPNYQYSDDYSVWTKNHSMAQQIADIKRKLGIMTESKNKLASKNTKNSAMLKREGKFKK